MRRLLKDSLIGLEMYPMSGEPEDCLNLTEMELEKYPFLKEAILLTEKKR